MEAQLRTVLRGLLAQGTPNLTQFIKDAIPHLSQQERNALQRELDRANNCNRQVTVVSDGEDGYPSYEKKRVADCTDDELKRISQRRGSKRAMRAVRQELARRGVKMKMDE